MFVPQSLLQTFNNQFLGIGAVVVVRRGESFEHFFRADELGFDRRTNEKMDLIWEPENFPRTNPAIYKPPSCWNRKPRERRITIQIISWIF